MSWKNIHPWPCVIHILHVACSAHMFRLDQKLFCNLKIFLMMIQLQKTKIKIPFNLSIVGCRLLILGQKSIQGLLTLPSSSINFILQDENCKTIKIALIRIWVTGCRKGKFLGKMMIMASTMCEPMWNDAKHLETPVILPLFNSSPPIRLGCFKFSHLWGRN